MAWPKFFRQPATQQAQERGWEEIPQTAPAWIDEEDEESGAGAWWIGKIILFVYGVAVIVFAYQTWQLVDTIFPADNQFMKISTVCCLDIMSLIFAMAEMLYPFKARGAKNLAVGMWLVTFAGALAASAIYMYLSSIQVLHGVVDMGILVWAYAIVVIIMAADVLSITVGIRLEVEAAKQERRRARFIRRQQAQAQAQAHTQIYSPTPPANNPAVIEADQMMKFFAQLIRESQQGGTQTDALPLVGGSQMQQHSGTTKKTASAHRAPKASVAESEQTKK